MIPIGCSVEALGARLDMRFIEIKVINCIDPQNCLINYLDPALLRRDGRVTQNIKLISFRLIEGVCNTILAFEAKMVDISAFEF